MRALLHLPFHQTFEYRPDFDRQSELLQPPQGRTLSWQTTLSYPSPPMSSPPSPKRKPIDTVPTTTSSLSNLNLTSTTVDTNPTSSIIHLPPYTSGSPAETPLSSLPLISPLEPSATSVIRPPPSLPRSSFSSNEDQIPLYRIESASSASGAVDIQAAIGLNTATASSGAGRGGRRSKTHVANACNNCKRAHLSCDVERPCNRCVQTGKGDTCRDVPHKKRGRPRLRDEGDFIVQQSGAITTDTGPADVANLVPASQGIGGSRHKRTGSLRTLRSYPDASGLASSSIARSSALLGSPFSPQTQTHRPTRGFITPVAFLDLDLAIMKGNVPFQDVLGVRDVRGLRLTDIARTSEGDSFQSVRNSLRAEREAKEPSYLPPILQPGLDPVSGITDQDIDEITRGFDDQHYNWTFRLAGGVERTLAVRIRLAKTSVYFLTLLLPPLPDMPREQFSPAHQSSQHQAATSLPPPTTFLGSPPQYAEPSFTGRDVASAPRSAFLHPQSVRPGDYAPSHLPPRAYQPFPPPPPPPPSAYQQPQPHPSYQQSPFHGFHPPPPPQPLQTIQERPATAGSVASIGSASSSFVPASPFLQPFPPINRSRSDTMESLGIHIQNRLRADSGVTPFTAPQSSSQQATAGASRASSDESAHSASAQEQSPRKRRRMNLDEVLH